MKTGGLSLDQAPSEDIPLRFFISAPIFGILAGLMVLLKGNLLFSNTWMPEMVALTHLLTLGWMGSVMFGALSPQEAISQYREAMKQPWGKR